MHVFIVLTAILAAVQPLPLSEVEEQQWRDFMLTYRKQYHNQQEENRRKEIFALNLHKFAEHNKKFAAGLVSYTIGVNQFTDITREEFLKTLTPMNVSALTEGLPFVLPANVKAPKSIDWRTKGAVTSVKEQGRCQSCYAFSATGALEGQLAIKTGNLVSLSEQNLLDCINSDNPSCKGGSPQTCFEYIKKNGGIDREDSYPYEGVQAKCRYDPKNSAGSNSGFVTLPRNNETALLNAVGTIGPISILIDANIFYDYNGGIIDSDHNCNPFELNHALLAVGYGTTGGGKDYWILKNSWGENFGERGYALVARNKNLCGLAASSTYPIV